MASEPDDDVRLSETVRRLDVWARTLAELDYDGAFALVLESLRLDPVTAWQEIVRNHSSRFMNSMLYAQKIPVMADVLDGLYADHPDMICMTAQHGAENLRRAKESRAANIDKGLPPLLMIAQGKSGSVSFGNIVPSGFGLTCTTYSMMTLKVIPSWARDFARGGACYVTHLRPYPYSNIEALVAAGLNRAVVQTRDPRQIYLSLLHHIDCYRSDFPQKLKSNYYALPMAERAVVDMDFYEGIIAWIGGYVEAEKRDMEILFTTFECILDDRQQVVDDIIDFYGADRALFNAEAAFRTSNSVDYHFRRGAKEEWRTAFVPAMQRALNERIPPEWFGKFGWNP